MDLAEDDAYLEQYEEVLVEDFNDDQQVQPQLSNDDIPAYTSNLTEKDIELAKNAIKGQLNVSTVEDIIHLSKADIQRVTRLNDQQVSDFLLHISVPLCANIVTTTALAMVNDESLNLRLSLGDSILDRCLGGGLFPRGITEIVGEAGTGKTQICVQLCLQVQLSIEKGGLGGGVCYICTEGEFPLRRLEQMMEPFRRKFSLGNEWDLSSNIFTQEVPTVDKLWELLQNKLPTLLQQHNIKLVIVDSIAALFRFEYSGEEAIERSKNLWRQANQLKLLSDGFNVGVVVVNQVSDFFQDVPVIGSSISSRTTVIPALGLTWSNCINTRIMLHRTKSMVTVSNEEIQNNAKRRKKSENDALNAKEDSVALRTLSIILSSHLPNRSCNFVVTGEGVKGFSAS